MVSKILIIVLIVRTASAGTLRRNLPPKPALAGMETGQDMDRVGCYIADILDFIEFGETFVPPIGNCYKITCFPQFQFYALCRAVSTNDPKCYETEKDFSKPYPSCCPTIKCDSDNHIR